MSVLQYLNRLFIASSILLNVILGGESNQTFSARNYRWAKEGKPNLVWLINLIFWFDPDHCRKAWLFWNQMQRYYLDISFFR